MNIRIYPNKRQRRRMETYLRIGCLIYNHYLEKKINTYKETKQSISRFDQTSDLTQWRKKENDIRDIPAKVERDAINRLDNAFKRFFCNLKDKKAKPGFPRFKSARRWHSFSISQPYKCVQNGRISILRIDGLIRCRNLRSVQGTIKVQRIVLKAGKWYCHLIIEDGIQEPEKRPIKKAVGIDVGLTHFATLSDGSSIENPRFLQKISKELRREHRRVVRRKKGSKRRFKAVLRLQKSHEKLLNHRVNFTHHLSKKLISEYDFIAIEDLDIPKIMKGRLAKHIMDAGWGRLRWQLTYKAERAGCTVVAVDPKGTSQECSQCGQTVSKDLSERIHKCPYCGLVLGRDENAARNILRRAIIQTAPRAGRAMRKARRALIRPASAG